MFYNGNMALDYRSLSRGELIRLLEVRERRRKTRVQAEERYRNLMEQAADGIFILDGHGICLKVNRSGARLLGRSGREIIGRHIRDFVAKDDVPALETDLASLRRRKGYRNERRLRHKNGSTIPVEVSVTKLSDGRIQGILRDITLRKQAEEALRQSEERFRSLTAAAFEGICINENGRILDVNDRFAAMFGYQPDELIGRKILTLIAPKWRSLIAKRLRSRQRMPVEHQLLRKDGSVFDGEAQSKVISWQGRTVRVTAVCDITERKQAEQALRESEEKYSKAFRASPDGLAISELETGRYIEVNEGYCKLYGFRRKEMLGRTSFELGIWDNPKDRALLVRGLKTTGKVRGLELRTRTRNGLLRIILVSAESIVVGGIPCLVSVLHDVTNRIQADQALRESEEKFSKAFRTGPDVMSITDLKTGRYVEVNDAYERVFGYRRREVIGRSAFDVGILQNPGDRSRVLRALKTRGFTRDMEVQARTRKGEPLMLLTSAELIELGGRKCVLRVSHDITARVRAEAALRASEKSLRATIEYTPNVAVQWFDAQRRVLYWNRASERMYGWTAREALGKTLDQLIFAPAEAAEFEKALKQIERTGQAIGPVEFPFHRRDGLTGVVLSTVFRIPVATGEMRFVSMDVDLTERKAAEAERAEAVLREQRARAEYTLQLIASQEAERARIAAELHDSLGQNLLLIKNRAQLALARKNLPHDLREQFEGIGQLAFQSIGEARQISHDLHPHQLDHLGLTRALEAMIDNAAESSGVVFRRRLDNVDGLFPKDAAMNLYRVVQESLNNVLKHSRARKARIHLERDVHEVQLHIEDDGCGFKITSSLDAGKGLGLKNIVERVRILGGRLKVDSQPGQGTRIEVTIPVPDDK